MLTRYDPTAKLAVMVDASDFAIGGVVQQFVNKRWQPLGFFFKRLNRHTTTL